MQLEVGAVTEGKVTGIAKFGVFVEIEKGVTGLVHISEISKNFVKDITKILKFGDVVKVKILSFENDKLSLSIKQVQELQNVEENKQDENKPIKVLNKAIQKQEDVSKNKEKENPSFEDMLAKFKRTSEEKMSDIKRNLDNKRSSYSKRR